MQIKTLLNSAFKRSASVFLCGESVYGEFPLKLLSLPPQITQPMAAKRKVRGAMDRIYKRTPLYYPIYYWVSSIFMKFYGKVDVKGLENIPKDAPVILTPNHSNALMDALIVLFTSPGDTVFLARADLFKKKLLARALNILKMLPVFRIRDGVEELGKNQEIFDITVGVLHKNHQLCIMPEGNHGDMRRLRNLQKGVFRIAFKAQEKMGNKPYVKIVPVGLDFSDFIKQNQSLFVNYGKPIDVSEYWDDYVENGPVGMNKLKSRLADDMKPQMIQIETEDYYDGYMGLRTIFNEKMREIMGIQGKKLRDKFAADKEMIARLDKVLEEDEAKIKAISAKVVPYFETVNKDNIRDWVVKKQGFGLLGTIWRFLLLVVTLPVFLYGFINNFLVYLLPVKMTNGIKDKQFISSVKVGVTMLVVLPFFYALQTLLVGLFTPYWWIWVAYLITLYPMGKLALLWYFLWKKTARGGWFGFKFRSGNKEILDLVRTRAEIIEMTETIVNL